MKRIFSVRAWWRRIPRLFDALLDHGDAGCKTILWPLKRGLFSLRRLRRGLASAFRQAKRPGRARLTLETLEDRTAPATVSGMAWFDVNDDGIRQQSETPVAGLTVGIYTASGTALQTALTNSDGQYSFSVAAGTYHVGFTAPPNSTFSPEHQGNDSTVDSDANPSPGTSYGTTDNWFIGSGDVRGNIDVGLPGGPGGGGSGGGGSGGGGGGSGGGGGGGGGSGGGGGGSGSISVTGVSFSATEGQLFAGLVARASEMVSSATINWGDGQSSTFGQVGTNIYASHTYTEEGTYTVTVTVTSAFTGDGTASESTTISVADPQLTQLSNLDIPQSTQENVPLSPLYGMMDFTDPGGDGPVSDYTATIHWGDGTTSAGTVVSLGSGLFAVNAPAHNYPEEGVYTITVTVQHEALSALTSPSGTITVTDPQLTNLAIAGLPSSGVEGITLGTVAGIATFTDPAGAEPISDYSATVNWGDGGTSTGTIVATGNGNFRVDVPGHRYADEGVFNVNVRVKHDDLSPLTTPYRTITITDAPLDITVLPFAAVEQAPFSGAVATFTDTGGPESVSEYTATINWGDGSSAVGGLITLDASTQVFTVRPASSHIYTEEGDYVVTVTIAHDTLSPTPQQTATVTVADAPLWLHGIAIAPVEGAPFSGAVATFTDSGGAESPSNPYAEYAATIDWGDGTPTVSGALAYNASTGVFTVSGGHTYTEDGPFDVIVTVQHGTLNPDPSVTTEIEVADAPLTDTTPEPPTHSPLEVPTITLHAISPQSATAGVPHSSTLATFTCSDPNEPASSFDAIVEWGDGFTSAASVTAVNGQYQVSATHTYANPGPMTAQVEVTHQHMSDVAPVEINVAGTWPGPIIVTAAHRFYAVEGIAMAPNSVLASFLDNNPAHPCHDVAINWGDGTPAATYTDYTGSAVVVTGSHRYAEAGPFCLTITVRDHTGHQVKSYATVYVDDVPIQLSTRGLATSVGEALSGVLLGAVTDSYPEPGELTAWVEWGDGSGWEPCALVGTAAQQWIVGGHTYAESGDYTGTIVAVDDGDAYAVGTFAITVADAIQNADTTLDLGTFEDADPFSTPADFTAPVDFGDGSAGPALVTATGGGSTIPTDYNVTVDHAWADVGSYDVSAVVTDDGGSALELDRSITVNRPALIPGGGLSVSGFEGTSLGQVLVAAFADPGSPAVTFTAIIDWGDGTTSMGQVTGSTACEVAGSHTYVVDGDYTLLIIVTDDAGRSLVMESTATIDDAPIEPIVAQDFNAVAGLHTGTITVATFTTPLPVVQEADAAVAIAWGDNTTSAGAIIQTGSDTYAITADHAYQVAGDYQFTVTLTNHDPQFAVSQDSATAQVYGAVTYIPVDFPRTQSRDTSDPERVLLSPLGEASLDLNTGGLRLVQPLDFDLSPGTSVGGDPALVYNSTTAAPHGVIQIEMDTPANIPLPDYVTLSLTLNGQVQADQNFSTAGFLPGDKLVFALEVTAGTTKQFAWKVNAVANYVFGSVTIPSDHGLIGSGTLEIIASPDRKIAPGWDIASVDHLAFVCGGVLWVTGSGDARLFGDRISSTIADAYYTLPPEDFGKLYQNNDFSFTYTDPHQVQWLFDKGGRLSRVAFPDGTHRDYFYDDAQHDHRLLEIDPPDGSAAFFGYDPNSGALIGIYEPGSRVVSIGAGGSWITDADGNTRHFAYAGNQLSEDQWYPYDATFTYTADLLTSVDQGLGAVWQVRPAEALGLGVPGPAALLNVATLTDARTDTPNVTSLFGIDLRGRETSHQNPDGGRENWARNNAGQVTLYTDASLNWTSYGYAGGDLSSVNDSDGNFTGYAYDQLYHQVTLETSWPAGGRLSVTANTYDQNNGELLTTTTAFGTPDAATTVNTWSNGLLQTSTDPIGTLSTYGYDGNRRLSTVTVQDVHGNPVEWTTYTFDTNGNPYQTFTADTITTDNYSAGDRLLAETVAGMSGGIAQSTQYFYLAAGQIWKTIDGDLNATTAVWDQCGRETHRQTVDVNGALVTQDDWVYDVAHNPVRHTGGNQNVETETRDGDGNPEGMQLRDAGGALASRDNRLYNPQGEVTYEVDGDGNYVTSWYNGPHHELTERLTVAEDGTPVSDEIWHYDSLGNLDYEIDADGNTIDYRYDAHRHVTYKAVYDANDNFVSEELWDYDPVTGDLLSYTDKDGNQNVYQYDGAGRLTYQALYDIHDALVRQERWTFDKDGNQLTYLDPRGVQTTQTFDGEGRVLTRDVSKGGVPVSHEAWTYDKEGRVRTYLNRDSVLTTTTYDAGNNVTSIVLTQNGSLVRGEYWTFDGNGNQLTYRDANNVLTTQTFDGGNRILTRTVTVGNQTLSFERWTYDKNGNTLTYLKPDSVLTTNTYDGADRLLTKTVTKGGQVLSRESSTYDPNGNAPSATNPDNVNTAETFDPAGRPLTRTVTQTINGVTTTVSYEWWLYDGNGNTWKYRDPNGVVTTQTFTPDGQVLTKVVTFGTQTVANESWTYYPDGSTKTHTDIDGNATHYAYDPQGNLIDKTKTDGNNNVLYHLTWVYDGAGLLRNYTDGDGNTFVYDYDNQGNKISQIVHHKNGNLVDQELWHFDPNGNEDSHTWNDGNVTTSSYNGDDRLLSQITKDSNGNVLYSETWTYDRAGNMLSHVDTMGRETRWSYDGLNRKISQTDAYGTSQVSTTRWGYDGEGNVISLTDPLNSQTTYDYYVNGNETVTTDPLGNGSIKEYDPAGLLISSTDRNGRRRDFTYDGNGNLLTDKWYDASGNLVQTNTFTYNAAGQMLTASNSNGTYIFHYDPLGRLVGVDEPFGLSLTFGYDADGDRILVQDSLGGTTVTAYDWAGRQVRQSYTDSSGATVRFDQSYDWAGRLAKQIRYSDAAGTMVVATTEWQYDAKGQVIRQTHRDAAGNIIADYIYIYNFAGDLIQQVDHGVTTNFGYDNLAQLVSDGTTNNTFDGNGNRTNTGFVTGPDNRLQSDATWNYSYDPEGNQTKKVNQATGETWTYLYDNRNQLVQVKRWSADPTANTNAVLLLEVDFKLDAFGNCLEEDLPTYSPGTPAVSVQRFAYDAWNPAKPAPVGNENSDVWLDLNGQNQFQTRYIRGDMVDELRCRVDSQGTVNWYLGDRQGTVRDIVDNSGTVQSSATYDGYGNIITLTSAATFGVFGYTGRKEFFDIHLQENHARFYDSVIGRWISQDPLGFEAGDSNLYRYVRNAPGNATDPSGLQTGGYAPQQRQIGNGGGVNQFGGPPAGFGSPSSPGNSNPNAGIGWNGGQGGGPAAPANGTLASSQFAAPPNSQRSQVSGGVNLAVTQYQLEQQLSEALVATQRRALEFQRSLRAYQQIVADIQAGGIPATERWTQSTSALRRVELAYQDLFGQSMYPPDARFALPAYTPPERLSTEINTRATATPQEDDAHRQWQQADRARRERADQLAREWLQAGWTPLTREAAEANQRAFRTIVGFVPVVGGAWAAIEAFGNGEIGLGLVMVVCTVGDVAMLGTAVRGAAASTSAVARGLSATGGVSQSFADSAYALRIQRQLSSGNFVLRALREAEIESVVQGNGILRGAGRTTPTQQIMGARHAQNPWISTTRSVESAEFFATRGGTAAPNPIILIDLRRLRSSTLDVSTQALAEQALRHPRAVGFAVAHQEVLVFREINAGAIRRVIWFPE